MEDIDKKAKNEDCDFILLTKLPSGNTHVVNITNQEIRDFMVARDKPFQVFENVVEVDFQTIN